MEVLPRIVSSYSQNWVAWLLLVALIGLGVVEWMQPGHYLRAFGSLFTSKERDSIFVGSGNDLRPRWLLVVVGVLLLALGMQWWIAPEGCYSIAQFGRYAAIALGFALLKFLMQGLVRVTFFLKSETETYERHYRYLSDCLTLLSWPVLLVGLYVPSIAPWVVRLFFIILICAYGVLVLYKQIACFRLTPASAIYLPLYFITTEVVPAGFLAAAAYALQ